MSESSFNSPFSDDENENKNLINNNNNNDYSNNDYSNNESLADCIAGKVIGNIQILLNEQYQQNLNYLNKKLDLTLKKYLRNHPVISNRNEEKFFNSEYIDYIMNMMDQYFTDEDKLKIKKKNSNEKKGKALLGIFPLKLKKANEEIATLRNKNEELMKDIKKIVKAFKKENSENIQLKNKKKKLKKQFMSIKKEKIGLENELKNIINEKEKLENEKNDLTMNNENEIKKLKDELKSIKVEKERLEKKIDELKKNNENEKNELKKTNENEIKELNDELKNIITKEMEQKDKDFELLTEKYKSIMDDNELLKGKNASLMDRNESLIENNEYLKNNNEFLKNYVISSSTENALSNVGLLNCSLQEGNINYITNINGANAYEGTGRIRLTFPKKGTITLKVAKGSKKWNFKWTIYEKALNPEGCNCCTKWGRGSGLPFSMAYKNGIFVIIASEGKYFAYSNDGGSTWERGDFFISSNDVQPLQPLTLTANDDYFVGILSDGSLFYSSDGIKWNKGKSEKITGLEGNGQDISWNGKEFFFSINDNVYTITSINSKDGLIKLEKTAKCNAFFKNEQFKYGEGNYVKKNFGTTNEMKQSSTINFKEDCHSIELLNLQGNSALNYGPGYWMILTQYGELMISTDASAKNWEVIEESESNDKNSDSYFSSKKTDWTGICYGKEYGHWVAYTVQGDVAILKFDRAESKIKISSTTPPHSIDSETTYTFTEDQIKKDANGNYYIEFEIENIKLVSASYSYSDSVANNIITKSDYSSIEFTCLNDRTSITPAKDWRKNNSNDLYIVSSSSDARITATKCGNISLTVAPSEQSTTGTIQKKDGSNSPQQITDKTIYTILASDMTQSGSNYYIEISINNIIILSAEWESLSKKKNCE